MRYFQLVHSGLDVAPILAELEAAADLWDENPDRTTRPETAHAATNDIWLRFFPRKTLHGDGDFLREARCEFYPAWHRLPSLHPVLWALTSTLRATEVGGALITRLPPGGRVLPHVDDGWHARHFNRKVYIPLQSNPWCINRCVDEFANFRTGEIWEFDNTVEHEVFNGGHENRITAILCFHADDAAPANKPAGD